jgi:hypothetical protein
MFAAAFVIKPKPSQPTNNTPAPVKVASGPGQTAGDRRETVSGQHDERRRDEDNEVLRAASSPMLALSVESVIGSPLR